MLDDRQNVILIFAKLTQHPAATSALGLLSPRFDVLVEVQESASILSNF